MDAKQISKAAALISEVGQQINALHLQLDAMIRNETFNDTIYVGDDNFTDSIYEESDWLITKYLVRYNLYKINRNKRVFSNYLSFQIDLDGRFAESGEPLIHIYAGDFSSCKDGVYLPKKEDGDYKVSLSRDGALLEWVNGDLEPVLEDQCWLFTVKLVTLNDVDNLRKYLLEPAFCLISGQRTELENIFSDNRYLKYKETEDGFQIKKED